MIRPIYRLVIVISLAGRAFAADTSSEAMLLDRIGQRVKQAWDDLTSVACTEKLTQEKLNENGKTVLSNRSTYDYLISLNWDKDQLLVDESRLEVGPPQKKRPDSALLATRGFATLLLIFHPEFQNSYHFTLLPEENVAGRKLSPVGFLPLNGARSPGVMELKGHEYPIAWEGTAWIDLASASVVRIQAHWKEPAAELGLETLLSDVHYAPVSLHGDRAYWLPDSALIEVKTRHQHWRNSHQFEHYKLFSVEADSELKEVHK
jgi:hypothetical protein